jgi:hypothetical protein
MPTAYSFSSALPYPRPFQHRIDALRSSPYRQTSLLHSPEQADAVANARRLPITPRQARPASLGSAPLLTSASAEAQQLMLQAMLTGLLQLTGQPATRPTTLQAVA